MAKVLAYVSGTALAPGVSRNNRLYTREAIGSAVRRAQQRIAEGKRPIGMYTYHETTNTRELVGGVTKIWQEDDGAARYVAAIADTGTGRDIASLVNPEGDEPAFLRGVSIRGNWVGGSRRERGPDGSLVEAGSDLEIGRLDYTSEPGVDGAGVDSFRFADAGDGESGERYAISESAPEALVETAITEQTTPAAPAAPGDRVPEGVREALRAILAAPVAEAGTPAVSKRDSGLSGAGRVWADPGYQKDKKQRYDISNAKVAKAGWAYINQKGNAAAYTPAQLKRVKGRIKAALGKFGVTVAAEGWTIDPAFQVTEAVAEAYGDPGMCGSYSISASNGPTNICVSGYGLDPADLEAILRAACDGACKALASLDPDMDGDIDVPGADAEDTDDDAGDLAARIAAAFRGESAENLDALITEARGAFPAATPAAPASPAPDPAAAPQGKEPAVSEATTTEAAGTAPAAATIPADVIEAAVAKAIAKRDKKAAKESAKPGKGAVTETAEQRIERLVAEKVAAQIAAEAPAVTETEDQKIERMVAERLTAERQRLTESGMGPARKGLSPQGAVNEHTAAKASMDINPATNLPYAWGDKPLHEMDQDTFDRLAGPALVRHVLKDRADLLA